jgi:hypothetical protein
LTREGKAVEACFICKASGFGEKGFPFMRGKAASFPIGAGGFAAVVEEAIVVSLVLEGKDGRMDECVEAGDVIEEFGWEIEVHVRGGMAL